MLRYTSALNMFKTVSSRLQSWARPGVRPSPLAVSSAAWSRPIPCTIRDIHGSGPRLATESTDSTTSKRPSPYRLLQPDTFSVDFAPLHAAGWRLDAISPHERLINPLGSASEGIEPVERSGQQSDLQGRRLVRAFIMGEGKEGWRDTVIFSVMTGELVEQEDHHPTILICPASDYNTSSAAISSLQRPTTGYVVEISTHTHTPLPPFPAPTKGGDKMQPGVTGKDLRLAERLELAWLQVKSGPAGGAEEE
ncbi:hypothetical protein IAU60_003339 [Kwoniella sp. DSM 27419]